MVDDRKDRAHVNIHGYCEVRYWARAFGAGAEELSRAVQAVGVMRDDVARHPGKA